MTGMDSEGQSWPEHGLVDLDCIQRRLNEEENLSRAQRETICWKLGRWYRLENGRVPVVDEQAMVFKLFRVGRRHILGRSCGLGLHGGKHGWVAGTAVGEDFAGG